MDGGFRIFGGEGGYSSGNVGGIRVGVDKSKIVDLYIDDENTTYQDENTKQLLPMRSELCFMMLCCSF